jgi:hypothetical protein
MGRPRMYESDAEKMRAYRARQVGKTVAVDARWYESFLASVEYLMLAVRDAAGAGDELAQGVRAAVPEDVVFDLTKLFEARSVALRAAQEASGAFGVVGSSPARVSAPDPEGVTGKEGPRRSPKKGRRRG